jgi:hypothetical protein
MEQSTSPTYMPKGGGGVAGHAFRMILCVLTGGFAFPNTFVEGMDLTALQNKTEGALYAKEKKGTSSKSRF